MVYKVNNQWYTNVQYEHWGLDTLIVQNEWFLFTFMSHVYVYIDSLSSYVVFSSSWLLIGIIYNVYLSIYYCFYSFTPWFHHLDKQQNMTIIIYTYNLYSTNLYLRCRGLKQSIYLPMRLLVMKISVGR